MCVDYTHTNAVKQFKLLKKKEKTSQQQQQKRLFSKMFVALIFCDLKSIDKIIMQLLIIIG